MKKIIIIVLILCIVIAVGCGLYFFLNNEPIDIDNKESGDIQPEQEQGLAAKTVVKGIKVNEASSSANRSINIEYPSIQSFKNQTFQDGINSEITSVIQAYRAEISTVIDSETPEDVVYTYIVSFDKYAHGDYLSLVVSNKYITGGIRSNEWKDTYNVDVRKERKLELNVKKPGTLIYNDKLN